MDKSSDWYFFFDNNLTVIHELLSNIKKAIIKKGNLFSSVEIQKLENECIIRIDFITDNIKQEYDESVKSIIIDKLKKSSSLLFYKEDPLPTEESKKFEELRYHTTLLNLKKFLRECIEILLPKNQAYNSIEYYNDQILKFKQEKDTLSEEIKVLKEKQEQAEASIEQKAELELELNEKSNTLLEYAAKIRQYEIERKKQEEDNDKIKAWSGKIKMAFETLKSYIKPIKDEHSRLNFLYKCYLLLSGLFILGLISFEIIICCKISACEALPTWNTYFFLIFPMPIALGLLWGFIYQMNRAQRQMVILAKQIHEVEYVEGLLLTTNTLSTDVNESMNRINTAVNQLLENHLSYTCEPLKDELFLKKEESKDSMPYEMVVKLLKDVASVSLNKS